MPSFNLEFKGHSEQLAREYSRNAGMASTHAQKITSINKELARATSAAYVNTLNAAKASIQAEIAAHEQKEAAILRGIQKRKAHAEAVTEYEARLEKKAEGKKQYQEEQVMAWRKNLADQRSRPGLLSGDGLNAQMGSWQTAQVGLRRFAGGYAQLLHSARATFDSIASGMPFDRVIAQQAPQVVQALIQMKLGWIALGAAALIAGHYVSKWVADEIYGLDALKRKYDELTEHANRLRDLRKDILGEDITRGEGEAAGMDTADEISKLTDEQLDAQLELNKQKAESDQLDQKLLGNITHEWTLKKKIAELEKERLKQKLESLNQQQPVSGFGVDAGIGAAERIRLHGQLREAMNAPDAATETGKQRIANIQAAIAGNLEKSNAQFAADRKKLEVEINSKDVAIKGAAVEEHEFSNKPTAPARNLAMRGFQLNALQRIGAYSTTPPDWPVLVRNVAAIARNTAHERPAVGKEKPRFGGIHQ